MPYSIKGLACFANLHGEALKRLRRFDLVLLFFSLILFFQPSSIYLEILIFPFL